jgi:hypothetical protein
VYVGPIKNFNSKYQENSMVGVAKATSLSSGKQYIL